ncbi:MAG: HDOD domain-containing protein [Pseudomonadota bacterium]
MSHHNPIINYLQREGVAFEPLPLEAADSLYQAAEQAGIPAQQVARAVLLGDEEGVLLAVLPLDRILDFGELFTLTGRSLEPLERSAGQYLFHDCQAGTIPPVAAPFGLRAVVDTSLLEHDTLYLEPGQRHLLLRLDREGFRRLHRDALFGRIADPDATLHATDHTFVSRDAYARHHRVRQLRPVDGMQERIKSLQQLPPLHPLGTQLLELYAAPEANIDALAAVIEADPSISAQLLRHARSPFYAYPGEVETVSQAITRVLGFDTALNTALGLSALRPFDLPQGGPLGRKSLWRSALHAATLCQSLAKALPRRLGVRPAQAYLAGLLHNFGFLALGHLLKPEYFLLNRVVEANPETPLTLIEKRTLGIDHTRIGAWLVRAWNLPPLLEVTVREHHNETYRGEHFAYANLVMLVNCLLKPHGLGDASEQTPPATLLNALGLSLEQALGAVEQQMEHAEALDGIAADLAA